MNIKTVFVLLTPPISKWTDDHQWFPFDKYTYSSLLLSPPLRPHYWCTSWDRSSLYTRSHIHCRRHTLI